MTLVLLDVNETLSDTSPLDAVCGSTDAATAWFAATLRDGFALTVVGQNPSFAEVGRAVAAGMGLDPDAVVGAMSSLDLHADVAPGLRALDGRARVATLSNGAASIAERLLGGLPVERVLAVADAGRWKPHPDAYGYALRTLGVDAADTLLVAVHPWDLDGAHRAGLRTCWLDRHGSPWPQVFSAPDHRVGAFTEVAGLV